MGVLAKAMRKSLASNASIARCAYCPGAAACAASSSGSFLFSDSPCAGAPFACFGFCSAWGCVSRVCRPSCEPDKNAPASAFKMLSILRLSKGKNKIVCRPAVSIKPANRPSCVGNAAAPTGMAAWREKSSSGSCTGLFCNASISSGFGTVDSPIARSNCSFVRRYRSGSTNNKMVWAVFNASARA